MRKDDITQKQLRDLQKLGFTYRNERRVVFYDETYHLWPPNVDDAIDFLRKKYSIMIYNSAAPYVDPCNMPKRVKYGFRVKFCNLNHGWNFREYIGEPQWSYNIYAAKRMCLTIAIKYAFKVKRAAVIKLSRTTAGSRSKSLK